MILKAVLRSSIREPERRLPANGNAEREAADGACVAFRSIRGVLGGEAVAGEPVCRRFRDIGRRSCRLFFLDLGEQPGLDRGSGLLLLSGIVRETARLDDNGAKLGDGAATLVVEVDKREAGAGHRILQKRDHRRRRQAMLAAQM